MSNYARAEMPAVYSYTEFTNYEFVAGLRPCFFAFFDGALLRYRPFYSIVKHE